MDLTNEQLLKYWNENRVILISIVAIIVLTIIGFAIYRGFAGDGISDKSDESTLPAIKVRVLNGCGYDRLATEFAEHISKKNIEVVELGDTPRPIYDKCIIVVKKDDPKDLQRLQKMTGISRYTYVLSDAAKTEFDIIVGRDYDDFTK